MLKARKRRQLVEQMRAAQERAHLLIDELLAVAHEQMERQAATGGGVADWERW